MTRGRILILGCGAIALVVGLVVTAGGAWLWHVSRDPEGMVVTLDVPDVACVDDEVDLVVLVENERRTPIRITDIDIAEEYLDGFVVESTDPPARSSSRVPFVGARSFTFGRAVPPGEALEVTFHLRAVQEGIFRGDLDVYEGLRSLTQVVETVVDPGDEYDEDTSNPDAVMSGLRRYGTRGSRS